MFCDIELNLGTKFYMLQTLKWFNSPYELKKTVVFLESELQVPFILFSMQKALPEGHFLFQVVVLLIRWEESKMFGLGFRVFLCRKFSGGGTKFSKFNNSSGNCPYPLERGFLFLFISSIHWTTKELPQMASFQDPKKFSRFHGDPPIKSWKFFEILKTSHLWQFSCG